MSSFLYSPAYSPPAPVVTVALFNGDESAREISVEALLDSGADGTIVPLQYLRQLAAPYLESRRMRTVSGEISWVDLYAVSLRISSHVLHGISAVGSARGTEILIGRDILNQLVVTLDGPAEVTEIEP